MRNTTKEIHRPDGTLARTQDEIKEEAVKYFTTFLNHKPDDYVGTSVEELHELLDFECNEVDKRMLDQMVSEDEIKRFFLL